MRTKKVSTATLRLHNFPHVSLTKPESMKHIYKEKKFKKSTYKKKRAALFKLYIYTHTHIKLPQLSIPLGIL